MSKVQDELEARAAWEGMQQMEFWPYMAQEGSGITLTDWLPPTWDEHACECGSETVGSSKHSMWCGKAEK